MTRLVVKPQGWLGILLDDLMTPFMYLISGTVRESPQRTHRWNNTKLRPSELAWLNPVGVVRCDGIPNECPQGRLRFHLPILKGWRNYVVIEPLHSAGAWYVGWRVKQGVCGVSRIAITGPVRVLLGPAEVEFFGIDARSGVQRALKEVGRGKIGDEGPYARVPLH